MGGKSSKNIVLFASGSGSNVENIARFFLDNHEISISGVFCNNPKAGVIERCNRLDIPVYCFNRSAVRNPEALLHLLKFLNPDLIVLAGYLWKIPESFVQTFPNKIINIHPALLPKFGGKGMYGNFVHEAVVRSGEAESGITIHYVNEAYDEGHIIFQAKVAVQPDDSPETVAKKIHELEYRHFPKVIQELLFS
ncbi:MAG: phosphoribosylglycinamide formyltransferase [Bacteroidota bacterium]|jgi:phosphoribosylglycinamide formyltransferase-1